MTKRYRDRGLLLLRGKPWGIEIGVEADIDYTCLEGS